MADQPDQPDRRRANAAKWAIGAGIGSAAILGGLLYAGRLRRPTAVPKASRLPEDLPDEPGNQPRAPDVTPG